MIDSEYILCAAICNPEEKDLAGFPLILCGHRHNNILWQAKGISQRRNHQGFLTSTGRFVDRVEALKIAKQANQLIRKTGSQDELYSDDLY